MGEILELVVSSKTKSMIEDLIIAAFSAITIVLINFHEPWGDEAQAWLIARDIPDLGSLVHQMGYEGSPALWHVLLLPLAKLGLPYQSMAILNFIIMLVAVVLFVKASPFSIPIKILFPFGYYILFEYTVIARSYSLTVLLLFVIALLYSGRFSKPVPYAIAIFLLANANLHSLVIAIALILFYVCELASINKNELKKKVLPIILFASGVLLAVYQLLPPPDLRKNLSTGSSDQITRIPESFASRILEAFIPFRIDTLTYWDMQVTRTYRTLIVDFCNSIFKTNFQLYTNYEVTFILMITSVIILLLTIYCLMKTPKIIILYLSVLFALESIFILRYGYARHHGLIFVFFVFTLWISNEYPKKVLKIFTWDLDLDMFTTKNVVTVLMCIILLSQIFAIYVPIKYELGNTFSNSEDVASFFIGNGYATNKTLIAGYSGYQTFPIIDFLPYMGRDVRIYSLEDGTFISYITWRDDTYSIQSPADLISGMENTTTSRNYTEKLLILGYQPQDENFSDKYNLIASFDNATAPSWFNKVYIYKYNK